MSPIESENGAEDTRRRLSELATLYELARALIGARDQAQVASRVVLSGLGALGLRSGAMLLADDRGRYRLSCAAGVVDVVAGETIQVPAAAREWMLREGVFPIAGGAAARGLGPLRERFAERYDASIGVAISDDQGLCAVLLFGPRLLPGDADHDLPLLEALATLASQALASGLPPPRRARRGARPRGTPARSLEALRIAAPALRDIIGDSQALLEAMQDLVAVAPTRFPVLLQGESGVGKELAARALHELSERRAGPFEVVDCGSIPRELIESELFGHVRGAFTGAHRDRRGAFEMAHRGTLFLDEIGEMPLQLQTRFLRVLQEGRFRRVGDERLVEVDVRVVAATNRDLRAEVTSRRFREDLYYRLNVFAIRIPPLRERAGDVLPMLEHFLATQAAELRVDEWTVDPEVIEALQHYAWPGNVRELANLSAALTVRARADGWIGIEHLNEVWRRQHGGEAAPWDGAAPSGARGAVGEWVLEQARAARFNLVEAARSLRRRKRAGQPVPVTERSAMSYYLTGEILRALVESEGDAARASQVVAGDEELEPRVRKRVEKLSEFLREAKGDRAALRRHFAKLPAGYEDVVQRAGELANR